MRSETRVETRDTPFLIVFGVIAGFLLWQGRDLPLAAENGPLENLQIAVLLLAAGVFLDRIARLAARIETPRAAAALAYSLVLICVPLIGAARETTFGRNLGLPPRGVTGVEVALSVLTLALLGAALTIWVRKVPDRLAAFLRLLRSPSSLRIGAAVAVFALSMAFEKGGLGLPRSEVWEEIVELVAFGLILRAAMLAGDGPARAA